MPDKVVKLAGDSGAAGLQGAAGGTALAAGVTIKRIGRFADGAGAPVAQPAKKGAGPASGVQVQVEASAPQWQCRLTLWDAGGRNPEECSDHRNVAAGGFHWSSPYPVSELNGRTLTWQARLFGTTADSFELRVEVLQDGAPVDDAQFVYTGPFQASEVEEKSGRFHLSVNTGSAPTSPAASPAPSARG